MLNPLSFIEYFMSLPTFWLALDNVVVLTNPLRAGGVTKRKQADGSHLVAELPALSDAVLTRGHIFLKYEHSK